MDTNPEGQSFIPIDGKTLSWEGNTLHYCSMVVVSNIQSSDASFPFLVLKELQGWKTDLLLCRSTAELLPQKQSDHGIRILLRVEILEQETHPIWAKPIQVSRDLSISTWMCPHHHPIPDPLVLSEMCTPRKQSDIILHACVKQLNCRLSGSVQLDSCV